MNYGEAKAFLLKPRKRDENHEEGNTYYDTRELAVNVVMLSFAENAERAATALTRIADAMERTHD